MPRSLDESTFNRDDVVPDVLARVSELERRVAALENRPASRTVRADVAAHEFPSIPNGIIPTLGKALLGLAGAYLLRALAESGTVPQIATVIAALLYAGAWLISSIRTGADQSFRAVVYTSTAAAIFAPLLWETTVRFKLLSPSESALALVLFVIAGYAVAWRRDLTANSRITTLAAAGAALGLLVATRDLAPFTIALLAMALVAEYAACRDLCLGERWIPALSSDVSLMIVTYIVTRPQGLPEGYRAIPTMLIVALQGAALAIYLSSISFRTLARGLKITWFEAGQATAVLVISIGGALQVTRGAVGIGLGGFCLLTGAAAYLTAFVLVDRRTGHRNLHAYALWGLTLVLAGSTILSSGTTLTAICGAFAILAMLVGRRSGHVVLRAHACVYLIGAALVSGLLQYCYSVSIELETRLAAAGPAVILTACAAALCYAASGATPTISVRMPAVIVAGLLCWSVLAFGSGALAAIRINVAGLATLRTSLLCAVAIGIALAGSRWGRGELLWLQYPVMVCGAAKLLLEDFPSGRPAALALSLLFFGGTLILLPRCRLAAQTRRA